MCYVIFKQNDIDCFLSLLYDPLMSVIWRTDMASPEGGTNIRQKDTLSLEQNLWTSTCPFYTLVVLHKVSNVKYTQVTAVYETWN